MQMGSRQPTPNRPTPNKNKLQKNFAETRSARFCLFERKKGGQFLVTEMRFAFQSKGFQAESL